MGLPPQPSPHLPPASTNITQGLALLGQQLLTAGPASSGGPDGAAGGGVAASAAAASAAHGLAPDLLLAAGRQHLMAAPVDGLTLAQVRGARLGENLSSD